jgi:hypothetical protein
MNATKRLARMARRLRKPGWCGEELTLCRIRSSMLLIGEFGYDGRFRAGGLRP